jgi:hypothetical protein
MSARLRRNAPLLRALHKATPSVRKQILRSNCRGDFIDCVCECARNILKGNVPLNSAQKQALRRRKKILHQLALKKTSQKKKKKLIQSGGFLGALLGPIVSVLGSLFGARGE